MTTFLPCRAANLRDDATALFARFVLEANADPELVDFLSKQTEVRIAKDEHGHVRVTWDDGLEQLEGWSRDSSWIYFSSTGRDIAAMHDIFRVRLDEGTPMQVTSWTDTSITVAVPAASASFPAGPRRS